MYNSPMFKAVSSKIRQETTSFSRWFKIALIIIAVIYFAGWIFSMHLSQVQLDRKEEIVLPVISQDSIEYALLSDSIMKDRAFNLFGKVNTFRVPGYPVFVSFLRLFINSYFFVTFVQIFIIFACAFLIRKIGEVFIPGQTGRKVGEIAAILVLINPVTLMLTLTIFTDVPFLFLLLTGFYVAVSAQKKNMWPRIFLASLLFTTAIYVRPMGFFALPIFFAPILASSLSLRDKFKSMGVMLVIMIVLISPWVIRNYHRTGVASFSSFKSMNVAYYSVPMFLAHKNHTSEEIERTKLEKLSGIPESEWRDLKSSKKLDEVTTRILLSNPFSYLSYHVITSTPFLFSSSVGYMLNSYKGFVGIEVCDPRGVIQDLVKGDWRTFLSGITRVWWKLLERLVLLVLYAFAAFGLLKNRGHLVAWSFACIALYLMILAGPAASVRYALQAWPFIFLLSGAGIMRLFEYKKSK